MRNLFFLLLFTAFFVNSCSKDKDDVLPGNNCYDRNYAELTDAINAYYDAAVAFSQDESSANCQTLKAKGQLYLNALEEWADCYEVFYPEEDWQAEIAEARQAIEEESCN